jgi:hypothetical protein
MKTAGQELTLRSALSDPLIRTLMTADNVDPVKLESMLRRIAEELKPSLSTEGRDRDKCRPSVCSISRPSNSVPIGMSEKKRPSLRGDRGPNV